MESNPSPWPVLEFALEREKAAYRFYVDLSQRIKDPGARDALDFLAREETRHRELLEWSGPCFKGGNPGGTRSVASVLQAFSADRGNRKDPA